MSDLVQLRRPRGASDPSAPASAATKPATDKLAYVETYGCQMNVADTDMVWGLLARGGYGRTDDPTRADLILINTCAVREKAEERVFQRTSMLSHAARPDVVLGVTGCMAEHLKDKLRERAPEVDLVIGPDGYRRLLDHVAEARAGRAVTDTRLDRAETYEGLDPIAADADGNAWTEPGSAGRSPSRGGRGPSQGPRGRSSVGSPSSAAATSSAPSASSPTRAAASAASRRARSCARRGRWWRRAARRSSSSARR